MTARLTLAVVAVLLLIAAPVRYLQGDELTGVSNCVAGYGAMWLIRKSKGAQR